MRGLTVVFERMASWGEPRYRVEVTGSVSIEVEVDQVHEVCVSKGLISYKTVPRHGDTRLNLRGGEELSDPYYEAEVLTPRGKERYAVSPKFLGGRRDIAYRVEVTPKQLCTVHPSEFKRLSIEVLWFAAGNYNHATKPFSEKLFSFRSGYGLASFRFKEAPVAAPSKPWLDYFNACAQILKEVASYDLEAEFAKKLPYRPAS